MKKLILFDMDGTLTEPRKCIDKPMHKMLRYLAVECKAELGIVTGSGYDYVQNQLWPLLNDVVLRPSIHLLPCNGTEYWPPPERPHLRHELLTKMNMREEIGDFAFKELMKIICRLQSQMIDEFEFPLTGHFVSNRESTINWCPIGRNADNIERERFTGLDSDYNIRKKYYKLFLECMEESRSFLYDASGKPMVDIVIGGSTSFDIYPTGWDKTFCLQYFIDKGYDTPWFIGDKCGPDGNDKPLYDILIEKERAFETTGPSNCIEIITHSIIPNL
tara:strand:+ start:13322 stop:14146 length:825 start_codon:yes stop_codon:yes gene_type:complete